MKQQRYFASYCIKNNPLDIHIYNLCIFKWVKPCLADFSVIFCYLNLGMTKLFIRETNASSISSFILVEPLCAEIVQLLEYALLHFIKFVLNIICIVKENNQTTFREMLKCSSHVYDVSQRIMNIFKFILSVSMLSVEYSHSVIKNIP